jgi:tetraacyldisaccharide 4'-kinase
MSAWLERVVVARWYGAERAPPWLLPLEALFRAATAARRFAYRRGLLRVVRVDIPVVVVGNVTVGGTGKTPLVLWLASALRERGWRPGIVSRGYGGRGVRGAVRVRAGSEVELVGDEALLIARRSGCPVAVGRDRVAAAALVASDGADIVLADDGLQHYALARDVEVAVLDGERGLGNGHCLPAGPLREPASRLSEVDAVVVHGDANGVQRWARGALPMQMHVRGVRALASATQRTLESFAGERVHALAGIGNPRRFFASLRACGLDVVAHPFPDHARLRREDIVFGDGLAVLMTEKDAVKCARFAGPEHWYVSVDAVLAPADAERLLALVAGTRQGVRA